MFMLAGSVHDIHMPMYTYVYAFFVYVRIRFDRYSNDGYYAYACRFCVYDIYMLVFTCIYICMYICTYLQNVHICNLCIYVLIEALKTGGYFAYAGRFCMYNIYVLVFACIYIYIYTYIYIYIYMCICLHICRYHLIDVLKSEGYYAYACRFFIELIHIYIHIYIFVHTHACMI